MRKLFSLCIGRDLGVKLNTCTSFSVAFYYFYMHIHLHDICAYLYLSINDFKLQLSHVCTHMLVDYNTLVLECRLRAGR